MGVKVFVRTLEAKFTLPLRSQTQARRFVDTAYGIRRRCVAARQMNDDASRVWVHYKYEAVGNWQDDIDQFINLVCDKANVQVAGGLTMEACNTWDNPRDANIVLHKVQRSRQHPTQIEGSKDPIIHKWRETMISWLRELGFDVRR